MIFNDDFSSDIVAMNDLFMNDAFKQALEVFE
jgi:hypothetical protein